MSVKPDAAEAEETTAREDTNLLRRRFDRVCRLLGDDGLARLSQSHVLVVGLGGVGSFAAEGLARSGVGKLTVVDSDIICITNSNRQLQALNHTVGQPKAAVLADRLRQINPEAEITAIREFCDENSVGGILADRPDFVVDAIDNITAKCNLLVTCGQQGIPVVASGGAAGRLDPTSVNVADLVDTYNDPMLSDVRKILRYQYGFPHQGPFGVTAVFSRERPARLGECDPQHVVHGTMGFVTGTFGLTCASVVVRELIA